MSNINSISKAVIEEHAVTGTEGWIFTNFHNRDALTDSLLSLKTEGVSTRRWVYIVQADGSFTKIVHAIEADALESLPGDTRYVYTAQETLIQLLKDNTIKGKPYSILCDEDIPVISTVDGGFISLLAKAGISTISAAPLIQRSRGVLSESGLESHERAAGILYGIIYDAWNYVCRCYKTGTELTEKALCDMILGEFEKNNLVTDHAPIIAFGPNSGNPHYEVPETGSAVARKGDVIQFDIWAKEKEAPDENGIISPDNAVYADISWVGVYDEAPSEEAARLFKVVCNARNSVKSTLESMALSEVTGALLDEKVRQVIDDAGFMSGVKHRTGHGIDSSCHGSGVNLDSVEFPDRRKPVEYSCFSVEPGLYFEKHGFRTEIDIYIKDSKPVISGKKYSRCPLPVPQEELLTIR